MVKKPLYDRLIEDLQLLECIKESHIASGGTYGSPWIHRDLRVEGESSSGVKVIRNNNIKAQIGYKRRHIKSGKIADNVLKRQFNPDAPTRRG